MTIQQRLIIERVADLPFEYIYTEKMKKIVKNISKIHLMLLMFVIMD